jgi:hypothetical protein
MRHRRPHGRRCAWTTTIRRPRYEMPAERFLDGSSLGQVLRLLEREPTATQRLLAAGDHCLTAPTRATARASDRGELLFLRAAWQAR